MVETLAKQTTPNQWHHLSVKEIVQSLGTDSETGLSTQDAQERRDRFGANELTAQEHESAWVRFLQQFNQPLLYILMAAGIVTAFLHEWVDAGVIFGVTILNAVIGFIQESSGECDRRSRRIRHNGSNHPAGWTKTGDFFL